MSPACPVFGFVIHLRLDRGSVAGNFAHRLVEFLSTRGLVVSGELPMFLISGEGMQATDADRFVIGDWLAKQAEITEFDVGPLTDVGNAA